jgi:hypothetical protein
MAKRCPMRKELPARIGPTGENGVERRSDWRGVKGAPFVYVWFSPRA